MRVTDVQITNIACFENLSLDFTRENAHEPASWIILLGENGTGKSTLLQMIGAALLNLKQFLVVAGNVDLKPYIRHSRGEYPEAEFRLSMKSEPSDSGFHFKTTTSWVRVQLPAARTSYATELQFTDDLTGGWFACGYGTTRRISGQATSDRGPIPTLDDSAKPYRFASLFGDAAGMTDVPDWLAGLYFQSVYPGHLDADVERYERARNAILRALPHISSLEVTKDRQILVTEGSEKVPLERLSDGYRGTLAWIGDLIRRLFDAYPDSADPLKERGVVLVDEIDLHLHPLWQRSIVEDVRKLFPNLQFIATTHSPFVAQDMRPQDRIIVLERTGRGKGGPVVAREGSGVIENWTADQILTAYFGMAKGTRGAAAQRDEARYERLLDAQAQGTLSDAQRNELLKLTARIDLVPAGLKPDAASFEQVADNVIASLRQRREELEAQKRNIQAQQELSHTGSAE